MNTAIAGAAILWLAVSGLMLGFTFRHAMARAWREPVLRAPVLILESDDWGYGPLAQAEQLARIADVLESFRDRRGRHPVATLGVVLAGPDVASMRNEECKRYLRLTLADGRFAPVLDAMRRGMSSGVFALQLHGLEHYWPDCIMRAARSSTQVRSWLTEQDLPLTESLSPALQSRWIDAVDLPSKPLPADHVAAAASQEIELFAGVFGDRPEVAVPPTFIWTEEVEAAWARADVRVVVTPGRRYEQRDREARPVAVRNEHCNGDVGSSGILYVVRDSYFEPALGHTHQRALRDLERNTHLGRPTLLEIHRMNFVNPEAPSKRSCDEVARLLTATIAQFPDVAFMTTAELARHFRDRTDLITTSFAVRLHVFLRRLATISRLRKLAWLTGAILPAWIVYVATGRPATVSMARQSR